MRKRDPLDDSPTLFERYDEWGDRHVLLGCLGTFLICNLALALIAFPCYWLLDQGTQGALVLGLVVGALVGGSAVYTRMRGGR